MFELKVRDWVKDPEVFNVHILTMGFFLTSLIMCTIFGLVTREELDGTIIPPCRQCLYIGLPIILGIGLPIILSLYYRSPKKLFDKAGFVWEKCPYICWIIKGCIESIAAGFLPILFVPIIIVKYIGIPIGIGFIKTIQTIGVICTIPDGKAEAKIKQIWSGK
jgi:membrane protease YdiL (CAAX protease family)